LIYIRNEKRGKEAWVMALPIARTPKLNAKETDKFLRDVETGLKNTVGYTPTPKLSEAKKAIRDYAAKREK
jgi:hypothetical protein